MGWKDRIPDTKVLERTGTLSIYAKLKQLQLRIGLVGHLRTQCNSNPTTSTSATPASGHSTTTNPTTHNHFIYAPPPTITDTFLTPSHLPPISATNTTCTTPATSVVTSNYLLPPPPTPHPVPMMGTRY
ncbi:unnamed protein product [Schistocephalus solidus]|uniref:Uncharacterized protein n=1 Tax=Schistocephalus solidus TaxID=70667 RepID=A0A183T5B0_SCHSO|nr:unnamed protein product [Schistocephalus solidus]